MAQANAAREGELSNAYNFHDPLTGDVNLRTGRVQFSLDAPVVPGIGGLNVDLGLNYSQPLPGTEHRILGLPSPWRYRLSYIASEQLVVNGGAIYTVDSNSAQGLRYASLKNMRLEAFANLPELPFDTGDNKRKYRNVLTFLNGGKQYFDPAGRLIAAADVHGNHILYYYNGAEDADVRQATLERIVDTYGQTFIFTHEEEATRITLPQGEGPARSIRFEFYKTSNLLRMKKYVGPTGRETVFSHTDGLIDTITSPSGLTTQFSYGIILARRPEGDERLDAVAKVTRTFQDTTHTTSYPEVLLPDQDNYTGYPRLFFNDDLRDLLMESEDDDFRYDTVVDDGITYARHIYNRFHLEMETRVYASANHEDLISKTLFKYPGQKSDGSFPKLEDLIRDFPDYQVPIEVEVQTYRAGDAGSYRSRKKTFDYNDQGQLMRKEESVSVNGKPFRKEKVETFEYDSRFGLLTQHDVHDYHAKGEPTPTPVITRTKQLLHSKGSLVFQSDVGFVTDEFKAERRWLFLYDNQGRVIERERTNLLDIGAQGPVQIHSYSYDPAKHRLTFTSKDALGNTISQDIDTTLGLVVSETDARNNTLTHGYDALGRKLSTVDPLNATTKWLYDDAQRTVTEEQADGYKVSVKYNNLGLMLSQCDNAGPNKTQRTLAAKTYDQHGRLLCESGILGDSSKVTYEYDSRGRISKTQDTSDNECTYAYDEVTNTQSESFNKIPTRKRTFDDRQQITREEIIPSTEGTPSLVVSTGHDAFDQVVLQKRGSSTRPDHLTHRITRDIDGNALTNEFQASNGDNVIDHEDRDLFGNVTDTRRTLQEGTHSTSARGNRFTYDAANRLDTIKSPLDRSEIYNHDANGNLITWTHLGLGSSLEYKHDARNALTRMSFTDAEGKHEFVRTYELQTQRLLSLEHRKNDQSVDTVEYTYKEDGLLTSLAYKPDGKTLKWEYSPHTNQLLHFTDSTGTRFHFTYTPQGKISTKSLDPLPLPGIFVGSASFEYYSKAESPAHSGKLKTLSHTLLASTTFTYDGFGRVHQAVTRSLPLNILVPPLLSITHTYDDVTGDLTRTVYASQVAPKNPALNRRVDYQYNWLGQLTQEEEKNGSGALMTRRAYAYDVAGNVVKRIVTHDGKDETTQFEYNADNVLVSIKDPDGTQRSPKHDPYSGNLTEDGAGRKFSYNGLDQLTEFVDKLGNRYTYDYYPDGLRKSKYRSDGAALRFYYDADPVPNIVHEALGKTSPVQGEAAPAADDALTFKADAHLSDSMVGAMRISRREQGLLQTQQLLFHDRDHVIAQRTAGELLGPPIMGNRFSAYGEWAETPGGSQNPFELKVNPFDFKGEYRDAESNLIYMRARYYDPGLMRFLSLDRVPFFNRYHYANGNPNMLSDPTGQAMGFFGWFGLVAGLIVTVATAGAAAPILAGAFGAVAGGIATSALAGALGGLTSSYFGAVDAGAQGESITKTFFKTDTLVNIGIGAAFGLVGGVGGAVGKKAGSLLLSKIPVGRFGSAIRSNAFQFASRHAVTATGGLFEGGVANITTQAINTGKVNFDDSFGGTLGFSILGAFLGKRLSNHEMQRYASRQGAGSRPTNPSLNPGRGVEGEVTPAYGSP